MLSVSIINIMFVGFFHFIFSFILLEDFKLHPLQCLCLIIGNFFWFPDKLKAVFLPPSLGHTRCQEKNWGAPDCPPIEDL